MGTDRHWEAVHALPHELAAARSELAVERAKLADLQLEMERLRACARKLYEVYDRPCEANGDWHHVAEYAGLDAQLRAWVGAPQASAPAAPRSTSG